MASFRVNLQHDTQRLSHRIKFCMQRSLIAWSSQAQVVHFRNIYSPTEVNGIMCVLKVKYMRKYFQEYFQYSHLLK